MFRLRVGLIPVRKTLTVIRDLLKCRISQASVIVAMTSTTLVRSAIPGLSTPKESPSDVIVVHLNLCGSSGVPDADVMLPGYLHDRLMSMCVHVDRQKF